MVQAKDVSEEALLAAIDRSVLEGTSTHYTHLAVMLNMPAKVVFAKAEKLYRRGILTNTSSYNYRRA